MKSIRGGLTNASLAAFLLATLILGARLGASKAREGERAMPEQKQDAQEEAFTHDVPGFDMKAYTQWLQDFDLQFPRQMTQDDSRDMGRIGVRYRNFVKPEDMSKPAKLTRESAFREWTEIFLGFIGYARDWDNVFFVDYEKGKPPKLAIPSGGAFLAGVDDQPFLFNFHPAGNDSMYVIKNATIDASGADGIRLTLDPKYPTLFKLFVSNIKTGENDVPVTVLDPGGEAILKEQWQFNGVEPGRIHIRIVDEDTGQPTPALIALRPGNGQDRPPNLIPYPMEGGDSPTRGVFSGAWPDGDSDNRVVLIRGEFEMPVYPGPCRLIAYKGFERLLLNETFDVPPGQLVEKTFPMKRFVNMKDKGWISGDDHCHISRAGGRDEQIMDLLSAVDLYATNIVQMGDEWGLYFLQPNWGETGVYWRDGRVMMTGQEDPRTTWRGHTLIYQIQNGVHNRETYYQYEDAFREAKKQGGLTGYAHDAYRYGGEAGATISLPLGLVDFIELEGSGQLHRDVLYHFWNLGFRTIVTCGADYPYGQLPGSRRFYAYVDGDFTLEKYMAAIKAGNTFATNGGAFLEMRIDGQLPGINMDVEKGKKLKVSGTAAINPDFDNIDRLEIIRHGEVIETFEPKLGEENVLHFEMEAAAEESCWIAGRLLGTRKQEDPQKGIRYGSAAHTSPFFIVVDGQPTWKRENLKEHFDRAQQSLNQITKLIQQQNSDLMNKQRPQLLQSIEEARSKYKEMEKQAGL